MMRRGRAGALHVLLAVACLGHQCGASKSSRPASGVARDRQASARAEATLGARRAPEPSVGGAPRASAQTELDRLADGSSQWLERRATDSAVRPPAERRRTAVSVRGAQRDAELRYQKWRSETLLRRISALSGQLELARQAQLVDRWWLAQRAPRVVVVANRLPLTIRRAADGTLEYKMSRRAEIFAEIFTEVAAREAPAKATRALAAAAWFLPSSAFTICA